MIDEYIISVKVTLHHDKSREWTKELDINSLDIQKKYILYNCLSSSLINEDIGNIYIFSSIYQTKSRTLY